MLREIVLDTETTGLDPQSGHRIVEIGCVELVNHIPSGNDFHHYVNPERPIPDEVVAIHGITDAHVADKPVFAAIADDFLAFLGDAPLIIHNAGFDMKFLNWELDLIGRPVIPMDRVVDTLELARRKHPAGPNNLDALCRRYRIDNSHRDKHGALLDSLLLAEVYLELIGGHQAALDLATAEAERGGGVRPVRGISPGAVAPRPAPLPPRLTEREAQAHRDFIETLGEEALWRRYDP